MPLTQADMEVLRIVARYYVLTRQQIQELCGSQQASGRGTRKRLSRLGQAGYIVKHRVQVSLPQFNGAAPVYYPTKKGAEALANYFEDERFLATNTKHPRADRLAHWISINATRTIVEQAANMLDAVDLVAWITEWETINKDDAKPQQFTLHTQLSETPPLSCSPDAAFLIECQGQRKVFYLEQDLGTSSPKQIAARKSKGYAQLANLSVHKKHFPTVTVPTFSVLFLTPTAYRATQTRIEMASKPGKELWFMVDQHQVSCKTFFTEDIALDSDGKHRPLVKAAALALENDLPESAPNSPHSALQSPGPLPGQ